MPIDFRDCPRCGDKLIVHDTMVEGGVKVCRTCKSYCLVDDDRWFDPPFPDGVLAALESRRALIKADSIEERLKEAWDAPIDDPRFNL
jgi:hypothetical protein